MKIFEQFSDNPKFRQAAIAIIAPFSGHLTCCTLSTFGLEFQPFGTQEYTPSQIPDYIAGLLCLKDCASKTNIKTCTINVMAMLFNAKVTQFLHVNNDETISA